MLYPNKFNKTAAAFGVGEWAGYSYNIGKGCSHNCLYCYARADALTRGNIANATQWESEIPNRYKIKIHLKADKRVMFPSTHDITSTYLDIYCQTLYNILAAGNDVLLVSKPHFECIEHICREFTAFKTQMEFRFTIGSINPEVTTFWEPGAPLPEERMRCLQYATEQGYQTSVSMEPMLEGKEAAIETFNALAPLTNGTIWIGMMNYLDERVTAADNEIRDAVANVTQLQSKDEIITLHSLLRHEPKVRWKDSIKNVVRYL
jgi:DNA repair photolyase